MPCNPNHFTPVSPIPIELPRTKGPHGGRRRGAGAPKGNLNALKRGGQSTYQQRLLLTLISIPEVAQSLVRLAERRRKQQRKAEEGAALLLGDLLRRTGEVILTPEDNQLQNNQELLRFLREAERRLKEILEEQTSETPKEGRSIKLAKPSRAR